MYLFSKEEIYGYMQEVYVVYLDFLVICITKVGRPKGVMKTSSVYAWFLV